MKCSASVTSDSASIPEQDFVWGEGRARVRLSIGGSGSLAPCAGPAFHQWLSPCGSLRATFHHSVAGYGVRFPDCAEFEISRDGAHVAAVGAASLDTPGLLHLFWNHVFPLAASLQGLPVLHAGAVEIGGAAVAFLGPSGIGKSTLTAAMARNGFPFLTDDALALVLQDDEAPLAVPGHPSIRLWQDSADRLAGSEPRAGAVAFTDKARVPAGGHFTHCEGERELRCIYLLGDRAVKDADIQPVPAARAVFDLAQSSFLVDPGDRQLLARQFELLSRIATRVPVFRVDYPRSFEALDSVCHAIATHASELTVNP
jgi:hypothetical protein